MVIPVRLLAGKRNCFVYHTVYWNRLAGWRVHLHRPGSSLGSEKGQLFGFRLACARLLGTRRCLKIRMAEKVRQRCYGAAAAEIV